MKNVPLARKIYWQLSLVVLVIMYGGQYGKHRKHEKHNSRCDCLTQCLFCAFDGIRGR